MDKYFAASNSASGFCSYYNECFFDSDKLYIIKGGPGTGKSGFMKKSGEYATRQGYSVEYFYCSSDPSSLDGIKIYKGDRQISVIDGTAPHVYDTVYPGLRDNIINLGEAWRDEPLEKNRESILTLCKEKNKAYRRAYDSLGMCGNLFAVIDSYINDYLLIDRIRDTACALAGKQGKAADGSVRIRLIDSVSMNGRIRFDTFERNADRMVLVGDVYGVGHIMLKHIFDALSGNNCDMLVSYDPVIPKKINGIFDTTSRVAYVLADSRVRQPDDERRLFYINMKRFISPEIKEIREDLKYSFSLYRDSVELALRHLSRAREYHFALEGIYKEAMNFDIVNEKIDRFCNSVL